MVTDSQIDAYVLQLFYPPCADVTATPGGSVEVVAPPPLAEETPPPGGRGNGCVVAAEEVPPAGATAPVGDAGPVGLQVEALPPLAEDAPSALEEIAGAVAKQHRKERSRCGHGDSITIASPAKAQGGSGSLKVGGTLNCTFADYFYRLLTVFFDFDLQVNSNTH